MMNNLKKWPKNWVEHVNETCFFYFENKGISFIDSKILCSDKTEDAPIYGIRLTFQKYDKLYDIFINYSNPNFIINYYYKDYYKIRKQRELEQDFVFMEGKLTNGSDKVGTFNYFDLGGQAARSNLFSPYNISQGIETTINFHADNGDDDDEGGENDPVEPFSPSDVTEPELLLC